MADIREITDFSAPELDIFARLRENQLANWECAEKGIFIAESPKVIGRALAAGYEPISFLMERRHVESQGKELLERCGPVPVFTSEEVVLAQMTGFHLTRGMLCAMKRRELPKAEQVCAGARRVAVLERVMNPTNVGAIFRSAAALGMDAVLLTPECSDPLYPALYPGEAWERCFRFPGPICQMAAGRAKCISWAFKRRQWPCGRIPCGWMIRACWRRSGWLLPWAPRGTAWRMAALRAATIPYASLWPTELTR